MMNERPTDPEVLARIDACLADLRKLAVTRRKEGATGIEVGCIKDNIQMLEDVRDYGAFGGKVPYPVNEPSLSIFKAHNLEDYIHPPWQRRNRAPR